MPRAQGAAISAAVAVRQPSLGRSEERRFTLQNPPTHAVTTQCCKNIRSERGSECRTLERNGSSVGTSRFGGAENTSGPASSGEEGAAAAAAAVAVVSGAGDDGDDEDNDDDAAVLEALLSFLAATDSPRGR